MSRVGAREHLISPELQAERISGEARRRGVEVSFLAPELDVSGSDVERPILGEIIRGIEEGRYAGVIVAQLDRLSRMDLTDALVTIRRIEEAGGEVISVAERYDDSPEGEVVRNLMLSFSRMQHRRYSNQFALAKERAVKQGIWPSPRVPIGYRKENRKLVPDDSARKVREAFEARAAGSPWSEVASILGRPISSSGKIVRSRVYLGEIRMGQFVNAKAHPAIVDRGLWEAAQKTQPRPSWARQPSLLGGLIRCAGCQGRMTAAKSGRGDLFYTCQGVPRVGGRCQERASISRAYVEGIVLRTVFAHLGRVSITASERTRLVNEAQSVLSAHETELQEFQEVTRVSDLGRETFLHGFQVRVARVEAARRNLASIRVQQPLPRDLAWEDLSLSERRHVLGSALGCVFVKKGRRVKVIEGDYEPPRRGDPVVPLDWDNLEGELPIPPP